MAQAANGYINFDPATGRFSLIAEQAIVLAVEDSPVYLADAFDRAAAMVEGGPKLEAGFRTGKDVRWATAAPACSARWGRSFGPAM